jgi:prepilin-type N-terminal cleavage/methylation domain-containing protein
MRHRAFTLVECVMVIVLTLILTAAAIGGLRGTQTWRASAAAKRVQSDLLYARSAALLSGRRTLCVFSTTQPGYQLQQEASPASGAIAGVVLNHPVTDAPWRVTLADLAPGLTLSLPSALNPAEIGFDTIGMPVNRAGAGLANDITINLGNGRTLTLRAGSGLCEVSWP